MGKEIDPIKNTNHEGIPDPVDSSADLYNNVPDDAPYTPELSLADDEAEPDYTPELSLPDDEPEPEAAPELTLESDEPEPEFSPELTLEGDKSESLPTPDLSLEVDESESISSPELSLEGDESEPVSSPELSLETDESEPVSSPELSLDIDESEAVSAPELSLEGNEPDSEVEALNPDPVPNPEDESTVSDTPSDPSGPVDEPPSSQKKHRFVLPLIILLLIGAIAGGLFLYTRELNNPQEIVKRFVAAAGNLDFDKLEGMTQSQDMSVLEGADVTSPLFRDFFLDCNKKLSCEIAGANMNVNQGTAQITAHLRFLDNTNVYRAALSELLLQTVDSNAQVNPESQKPDEELSGEKPDEAIEADDEAADAGDEAEEAADEAEKAADEAEEAADAAEEAANEAEEAADEAEEAADEAEAPASAGAVPASFTIDEEMQQRILDLMLEKQVELEPEYVETDIVYNLIKVNRDWKLVALDRETVRAISANCISIQAEIDRLRENPDTFIDNRHLEEENIFSLDTEQYSIQYAEHHVEEDYAGHPCLFLYYDYTNKGDHPAGALMDVNLSVLQHGKKCMTGIPERNRTDTVSYLKEVKPGETARICQVFALMDLSDVTVQAYEGSRLSERELHSVVIRLE